LTFFGHRPKEDTHGFGLLIAGDTEQSGEAGFGKAFLGLFNFKFACLFADNTDTSVERQDGRAIQGPLVVCKRRDATVVIADSGWHRWQAINSRRLV
jgi:hypothetical protein